MIVKGNRQNHRSKNDINMTCFLKNRKVFRRESEQKVKRFDPFSVDEMVKNFNKLNKKKEVRK